MGKIYTRLTLQRRKNPTLWGGTYPYGIFKGVLPWGGCIGFPSIKSSYAYIWWLGLLRVVQALKVIILPLPLSAGVMCCLPLIFKPSLGRRKKLPQKVGRREKLPQKVGRREIYRPVPLPSTDALLINRIICDSSWLKSKTVWWFEDACTKAVYNVTLFSINKTIIYQVTMYVQYISVLRQIWYFCAYILPGCCEDFFCQTQSDHKNWIWWDQFGS